MLAKDVRKNCFPFYLLSDGQYTKSGLKSHILKRFLPADACKCIQGSKSLVPNRKNPAQRASKTYSIIPCGIMFMEFGVPWMWKFIPFSV
jgi:hypothetical protein